MTRVDASAEAPDSTLGDASWPGSLVPGCFALCGDVRVLQVTVTSTPEQ